MINKIESFYLNLKYGIKNTIKWFTIIWNLRYWDYSYIYQILRFYLENMEYHMKNYNMMRHPEKVTKNITIAKNLAKRLEEGNYTSNAIIPIEKKYGMTEPEFIKIDSMTYKFVNCRSLSEEEAMQRAYIHSDYMEKQDREMLFNILNKHINSWWD